MYGAKDQTQGLLCARYVFCHWVTYLLISQMNDKLLLDFISSKILQEKKILQDFYYHILSLLLPDVLIFLFTMFLIVNYKLPKDYTSYVCSLNYWNNCSINLNVNYIYQLMEIYLWEIFQEQSLQILFPLMILLYYNVYHELNFIFFFMSIFR